MIKNQLSVIIPYREPAPYLTETLACLKAQSIYKDLDIILIKDDGNGVSATRNRGLDKARGEFIYFIDADDVLVNKEVLRKARDIMIHNKNLDFLYGDIIMGDNKLQAIEYYRTPQFHGEHLGNYLIHGGILMLQPMLFRNNGQKVYFRPYEPHGDLDYILRKTYKRTGRYINMPFIIYRKHAEGISLKREPGKAARITETLQIYRDFLLTNVGEKENTKYFRKIMARQSLVRVHILHTFYYRKEALSLILKTLKYFPFIVSKKLVRVIIEFFIPPFFAKKIRISLQNLKILRYKNKNTSNIDI